VAIGKKGQDLSTIIGLPMGFGMLLLAFVIEGGNLGSLYATTAVMIVIGGTMGATMISYKLEDILSMPKLIMEAMSEKNIEVKELIEMFITFAEKARREGILSLESDIEDLGTIDPMIHKGMKLIVDGTDPEIVRHVMENDIYLFEERKKVESDIFNTAGGFSPTMGIIGTVMGLVKVLGELASPESLGPAIALAFTATLWGVGIANLFWIPMANKIKLNMKHAKLRKELVLEAVISIQQGENPSVMRDKMEEFLNEKDKANWKRDQQTAEK
jgi:chemotaxis protein MotA